MALARACGDPNIVLDDGAAQGSSWNTVFHNGAAQGAHGTLRIAIGTRTEAHRNFVHTGPAQGGSRDTVVHDGAAQGGARTPWLTMGDLTGHALKV